MKVLVLTLSFGSGHVRAAEAVADELSLQRPASNVLVVDALAECRWLFRSCYEWPYWLMLRYAPGLWDRFSTARVNQKHEGTAPAWAFRMGCPKVFATIESFNPDVIVAAEVAACEMVAIARRLGLTKAPILSVITDYESEPIWVQPEVAGFTVPDEHVRAEMISWGAPADRISICGIPVDPAFDVPHNPKATRLHYGISDNAPMVLLMGGGMGPTRMDQVIERLGESDTPMHIVAVAGKDKRALRRLERLKVKAPVSLRVVGWTNEVPALMQAARILVTKPGGLTIAEAALCSLPVVFFDPIPGAEFVNAKRMVDAGAALITQGPIETAQAINSLLKDEKSTNAMALRSQAMARPDARREIASLALALLEPVAAATRRRTA
ncbi:MAG: processive 1,2-diacylglycerol beta-glucosyltransferase [Blastocatellia bacterium]|jgi:processive 1,2-diacylglycerol beta-glucosyltransferase|nr:processive 1,2-diacylglycerol beta-glucosyltransferase [Blastocatellia bacterium]